MAAAFFAGCGKKEAAVSDSGSADTRNEEKAPDNKNDKTSSEDNKADASSGEDTPSDTASSDEKPGDGAEATPSDLQIILPASSSDLQTLVPEGAFTIVDMTGREIVLNGPAKKIVALTASDCEIIYALGAGDLLVGRGEYCDYPAEVMNVPSVQSGYDTNIEQIIALSPDVLVMSTMAQTEEQIKQLESAGIKVVVSDAKNIEGVYTAIKLLGLLTGKSEEAKKIISDMTATFTDAIFASEGDGTKSIYFEVSPLQWGLWAAGAGTFMDEICNMLGYNNAFADVQGWGEVSEEQVLARNPDYIVTISMYYGEGPTPVEEIASRAGWSGVSAVANGRILNLQNNELSRPAPRLAEGAKLLVEFLNK